MHPNGVSIHPMAMEDRELYRRILGVENPWRVASGDLQVAPKEVHVYLAHEDLPTWPCAECGGVRVFGTASVRILLRMFTSKGPSSNSPMVCSKCLKWGVATCLSSAA